MSTNLESGFSFVFTGSHRNKGCLTVTDAMNNFLVSRLKASHQTVTQIVPHLEYLIFCPIRGPFVSTFLFASFLFGPRIPFLKQSYSQEQHSGLWN